MVTAAELIAAHKAKHPTVTGWNEGQLAYHFGNVAAEINRAESAGVRPAYDPRTGLVNPDAARSIALKEDPSIRDREIAAAKMAAAAAAGPQIYIPGGADAALARTNGNGAPAMIVSRHQLGISQLGVAGSAPAAVANLNVKQAIVKGAKWAVGKLADAVGKEVGSKLPMPGGGARLPTGTSSSSSLTSSSCPQGFEPDGAGGCRKVGLTGAIERTLPGGDPGRLTSDYGAAVIGAFGTPALEPRVAGTTLDKHGVSRAVLRCPAGMVLGKDDLCYARAVVGRRGKFRKHKPSVRPPITAGDTAAIRRAARARDRVKELAKDVGWSVKKR